MDIVTLGAALNGSAEYVNSHFKGGSNIQIVDNPDGTQTINASGEVSAEDTVARAEIAEIKDGETLDSFGDVETALGSKQNTISDLATIRSGAALGATAVQPETGKGLSTNDYTTAEKTKLAGIAEGAEVNVQSNWTQATTTADDYIKNKPTLGTAAAKNATDTYNATGTDVTTGKAVAAALATLPEPMVFKGSLGTGGTITTLPSASSSNKGYVYKVITAGTYASQSAKAGDTFISDGSAWVLIPSGDEPSGTVTNVAVANGGGLTVSGSPITSSGTITVGHSNSVTAKTSSSLKKFTYDAYGHVTGSSELSTAESNALASGIDSTKVAQIETNKTNISSVQNVLSQTYNSADCNMSIYLCQDNGAIDESTYYMTDQSKMHFKVRHFRRLLRYWKDGVEYQKYHWSSMGLIATNNSAKKNMLTLDIPKVTNETYVKIQPLIDDDDMDTSIGFAWQKSSVNVGDVWYIRPHMEYTDLETGMEYTMYGAVYKVTVGTPCTIECDTLSCTELTAAIQTLQAQLGNTTIKIITKTEYDSIVHDENTIYYVKDGDKVVQYLGDAKFGTGSNSGSSSLYGVANKSVNGNAEFSEIS